MQSSAIQPFAVDELVICVDDPDHVEQVRSCEWIVDAPVPHWRAVSRWYVGAEECQRVADASELRPVGKGCVAVHSIAWEDGCARENGWAMRRHTGPKKKPVTRRAISRDKKHTTMQSNIIPFPVSNRRDPSPVFFARYVDIESQISDPNTADERRSRLRAMLDEIDGVMARQVRS